LKQDITFEHPITEKCRTWLRLAHLFGQFQHHLPGESEWDSRAAVVALLDIVAILGRADIKSDLIKELERFGGVLSQVSSNPRVDHVRLGQLLEDINRTSFALKNDTSQLGHRLRTSDFLKAIMQRTAIPGGSFDFDLPQYHRWLAMPHSDRVMQLDGWRSEIGTVEEAVNLLLEMIRHSDTPRNERASNGFFQETLDPQRPVQMVRVSIAPSSSLFAEISGGRHRFSVRFLDCSDLDHPAQTTKDLNFKLTTCVI